MSNDDFYLLHDEPGYRGGEPVEGGRQAHEMRRCESCGDAFEGDGDECADCTEFHAETAALIALQAVVA